MEKPDCGSCALPCKGKCLKPTPTSDDTSQRGEGAESSGADILIVPADPRYPLEKRPLITNEMKAECIGEFYLQCEHTCTACHFGEPQDDCEVCAGEVTYHQRHAIPWDICKDIYKRMAMVAAKNKKPMVSSTPSIEG
jgi:hypothetical protein